MYSWHVYRKALVCSCAWSMMSESVQKPDELDELLDGQFACVCNERV